MKEVKKYEFTGETKEYYGVTLHQIRALITIAEVVSVGKEGGWIEQEKCLSQIGDAWVYGNARVYGNAQVSGNAQVTGDAQVSGNAWVFSGFGSEYRTTTAFHDKKLGIRIACGCFTGSLEQFRAKVISTHCEDSKHGKLYLGMANMIEHRLGEDK